MSSPRKPDPAIISEFLELYFADLKAGQSLALEHYQARFSNHAELIAREWQDLNQDEAHSPSSPADSTNLVIGHYRIERELGRGGQGVVYLAHDLKLPRQVALKVLRTGAIADSDRVQRFEREAKALSRLDHPGICSIIDVGTYDTLTFIAMRYVKGETLEEVIRKRKLASESRDITSRTHRSSSSAVRRHEVLDIVHVIEQCARALHAAHLEGLVHRDLKPGNIMIGEDGRPVLFDFGLARELNSNLALTETGDQLGTPSYMAPEQVAGSRDIRAAADIWALGVTLYESLTLQRPFIRETRYELQKAIMDSALPDPYQLNNAIPKDLGVILSVATDKDPKRRYISAEALADDLQRVRRFEPIAARPIPAWKRLKAWARRNRALTASLATVALLIVGLSIAAVFTAISFAQKNSRNVKLAQRLDKERQVARKGLYFAQMNLAAQALAEPGGIPRVRELISQWQGATDLGPRFFEYQYLKNMSQVESFTAHVGSKSFATAWNPDSRHLAAGTPGAILIMNPTTGTLVQRLSGLPDYTFALEFSPDGRWLAAGGDKGISVWDTKSWECYFAALPKQWVNVVGFSPDSQRLMAHGERPGILAVFDIESKTLCYKLTESIGDNQTSYRFTPDGKFLSGLLKNRELVLWDAQDGRQVRKLRFDEPSVLQQFAWHPSGAEFACAFVDGRILTYRATNGETIRAIKASATGFEGLAYSPDGTRLAAGGWDHVARIWNAKNGAQIAELKGHAFMITNLSWSWDSQFIATSSEDGRVSTWNLNNPAIARSIRTFEESVDFHFCELQWAPSGSLSASSAHIVRELPPDHDAFATKYSGPRSETWHSQLPYSVTISNRCLQLRDANGIVKSVTPRIPGPQDIHLEWHPTKLFLTYSSEKSICRWEPLGQNPTPQTLFAVRGSGIYSLAWTRQGQHIAAATGESIECFDPQSRTQIACIDSQQHGSYTCLASDARGLRLAAGGTTRTIDIIDMNTFYKVRKLRGHTGRVFDLCWSSSGSRIASCGNDGTLRVWDSESGLLALNLPSNHPLFRCTFDQAGNRLAALDKAGQVHIWDGRLRAPTLKLDLRTQVTHAPSK